VHPHMRITPIASNSWFAARSGVLDQLIQAGIPSQTSTAWPWLANAISQHKGRARKPSGEWEGQSPAASADKHVYACILDGLFRTPQAHAMLVLWALSRKLSESKNLSQAPSSNSSVAKLNCLAGGGMLAKASRCASPDRHRNRRHASSQMKKAPSVAKLAQGSERTG
jgi:hypothetical protein